MTDAKKSGPSDATSYSSTQAPETKAKAEERDPEPSDYRLIPGGAHGARVDTGMSSLVRDLTFGREGELADDGPPRVPHG